MIILLQLSFFKSTGSFAMFAATRRASSFVNLGGR